MVAGECYGDDYCNPHPYALRVNNQDAQTNLFSRAMGGRTGKVESALLSGRVLHPWEEQAVRECLSGFWGSVGETAASGRTVDDDDDDDVCVCVCVVWREGGS